MRVAARQPIVDREQKVLPTDGIAIPRMKTNALFLSEVLPCHPRGLMFARHLPTCTGLDLLA